MSDASRDDLPRISFDSLVAWQRVKDAYRDAAIENLHAEARARGKEFADEHVVIDMQVTIDSVLEMAKKNIRVNGINLEDIDDSLPDVQPFDEALDRQIYSLADQQMRWDVEIAKKRREIPTAKDELLEDAFSRQREAETAEDDGNDVREMAVDDEDDEAEEHEAKTWEQIDPVYRKLAALVNELEQSVPIQQDRLRNVAVVRQDVRNALQ